MDTVVLPVTSTGWVADIAWQVVASKHLLLSCDGNMWYSPAVCRDSTAVGTYFKLIARICSPYPGIMRLQTASVASGVTSLGAGPVPPVVTTKQQPCSSICSMQQDNGKRACTYSFSSFPAMRQALDTCGQRQSASGCCSHEHRPTCSFGMLEYAAMRMHYGLHSSAAIREASPAAKRPVSTHLVRTMRLISASISGCSSATTLYSALQGDCTASAKKPRIAGPLRSSYTPVLALSLTVSTPNLAGSPMLSGLPPESGAFVSALAMWAVMWLCQLQARLHCLIWLRWMTLCPLAAQYSVA